MLPGNQPLHPPGKAPQIHIHAVGLAQLLPAQTPNTHKKSAPAAGFFPKKCSSLKTHNCKIILRLSYSHRLRFSKHFRGNVFLGKLHFGYRREGLVLAGPTGQKEKGNFGQRPRPNFGYFGGRGWGGPLRQKGLTENLR